MTTGCTLRQRFGAAMTSTANGRGVLVGGMDDSGVFLDEIWEWAIRIDNENLSIQITNVNITSGRSAPNNGSEASREDYTWRAGRFLGRIGACLINSQIGLLLIGGVSGQISDHDLDIVRLTEVNNPEDNVKVWQLARLTCSINHRRPLLVGHTALSLRNCVILVGGGATCFSFGTYWNQTLITLFPSNEKPIQYVPLAFEKIGSSSPMSLRQTTVDSFAFPSSVSKVKVQRVESATDFEHIVDKGFPVIIRGSRLGSCTSTWTLDALKASIGLDRAVSIAFVSFRP